VRDAFGATSSFADAPAEVPSDSDWPTFLHRACQSLDSRPPSDASGTSGSNRAPRINPDACVPKFFREAGGWRTDIRSIRVPTAHTIGVAQFGRTRRVRSDREGLNDAGNKQTEPYITGPFRLIHAFKRTSGATHARFDALR
jgi:hypothetical protein